MDVVLQPQPHPPLHHHAYYDNEIKLGGETCADSSGQKGGRSFTFGHGNALLRLPLDSSTAASSVTALAHSSLALPVPALPSDCTCLRLPISWHSDSSVEHAQVIHQDVARASMFLSPRST